MDWTSRITSSPETVATANNNRLISAAHQFEASLLSELVKPLQENPLFADRGTSEEQGTILTEYASQAFGQALSEHGGFGIARKVLAHLQASPVSNVVSMNYKNGELSKTLSPSAKVSAINADNVPIGSDK